MLEIPKEDIEAECLAQWLRLHKYKFAHIGNEAGQAGTHNIIKMMAKKKRMGVSPGFPDYCIVLKRGSLLFVELKRQRKKLKNGELGASPSKVSDEQVDWVYELGKIQNVDASICYGWRDAMETILYFENL